MKATTISAQEFRKMSERPGDRLTRIKAESEQQPTVGGGRVKDPLSTEQALRAMGSHFDIPDKSVSFFINQLKASNKI